MLPAASCSPCAHSICASACVLIALLIPPPASATGDIPSAISHARAAADGGDHMNAFSILLAALKTYPESQWERATLRALLLEEAGHQWFPRLSADQQAATIGLASDADNSAAVFLRGYGLWRLNRRDEAMQIGSELIQARPESIGAELAIFTMLFVKLPQLDDAAAAAEVRQIVAAAPNNSATAWAISEIAWRFGSKSKLQQGRTFLSDIATLRPENLSTQTAGLLEQLLERIEAADFHQALEISIALPPALREEFNRLTRTFLASIDFNNPQAFAARIAAIEQALGPIAENDPDPDRKSLASAVLGRLAERRHDLDQAAQHYQRIIAIDHPHCAWYAHQRIGSLLRRNDPNRAIAALEAFKQRRGHLNIMGDEPSYLFLLQLYTRQKFHAKAESLGRYLLERAEWGEVGSERMIEHITAGLAGALFAQNKNDEAQALIAPYFAKYHYGTPIEQLTLKQRADLGSLLLHMGRFDEASELHRIRAP